MGTTKLKDKGIVTTMNTNDTVPLVLENGAIVRIKKADLVESIRVAMPIVSRDVNGLADYSLLTVYKGDITDCNISTGYGIFRCVKSTANMPIADIAAAILISFRCYEGSAYVFQLWFNLTSTALYWRRKTDENWSGWVKLS